MPDPQTDNSQPTGGMINGGQAGITGGTGFFGNLVSTLVRGAVQGGVAALGQNQGTPGARAMAAGINAQQVQQQKDQQQQDRMDEQTERKMRIAMSQVQMLQAKHLLAKEDQETRNQVYNANQAFTGQALDDGKIELFGGTTEDDTELQPKLSQLRKQDPDGDYRILNMPGSTPDKPLHQIGKISNDPFGMDVTLPAVGGHEESGIPPTQTTIPKGTGASSGAMLATSDTRQALIDRGLGKNAEAVTEPPPQRSLPDLLSYLRNVVHAPIPKNIGQLYMIANNREDYDKLREVSGKGEIGRDRGAVYINKFINPTWDPKQAVVDKDMMKKLEAFEGPGALGTFKDDKAPEAMDFALNEYKNSTSPMVKQQAAQVYHLAADAKQRHEDERLADQRNSDSKAVTKAVDIEVAKAAALAPDLEDITKTTLSGRKYIDAGDLSGDSGKFVRKQAGKAQIPVVQKEVAATLGDIDNAKLNQGYMMQVIGKFLAKDPTGRLYTGPANTIARLAQTNPELAAIGTFRNAAVQSMKALIGRAGLRLNQYEVQMAIDNDIPKDTDTLAVAQTKLRNMMTFLSNAERAHLPISAKQAAMQQQAMQNASPRVQTFLGAVANSSKDEQVKFVNSSKALTDAEKKEALQEINGPATTTNAGK